MPSAALFRGIGWAGLHSALDNPQRDTFFLFKSSPFGSVSHSHADQNSFAIMKGGRALAIPTISKRLTDIGQEIVTRDKQTPEALHAFHKAEIEKWWPIIEGAKIRAESR